MPDPGSERLDQPAEPDEGTAATAPAGPGTSTSSTAPDGAGVSPDPVPPVATTLPDEHRPRGTWGRPPFVSGFLLAAGALLAYWFGGLILQAGSVIILIVVSLFIAFGLNPVVRWLVNHGIRRSYAVLIVALAFIAALALFVLAIAPVVADQISALTDNAPAWFQQLQDNRQIKRWDKQYDIIHKAQDYVTSGDLTKQLFGGVLGVGLKILAALGNAFVVIVLTLYFLATLDKVKAGLYRLAPASRRARVQSLGDRILEGIGGYVSGAFVVALCAGISTLVFLFIVGLGQYAVALAVVVALLDVIPMIGATLGAIVVSAIALATDVQTGIFCIIFFVIYQQVENYLIYPRVMSKSVDIPGALTVIAALSAPASSASSAPSSPSPRPPPSCCSCVRCSSPSRTRAEVSLGPRERLPLDGGRQFHWVPSETARPTPPAAAPACPGTPPGCGRCRRWCRPSPWGRPTPSAGACRPRARRAARSRRAPSRRRRPTGAWRRPSAPAPPGTAGRTARRRPRAGGSRRAPG